MSNLFLAIIAFGVMIFVHELGHFLMAKRLGVTVYVFALGVGPEVVGFTHQPDPSWWLCAISGG